MDMTLPIALTLALAWPGAGAAEVRGKATLASQMEAAVAREAASSAPRARVKGDSVGDGALKGALAGAAAGAAFWYGVCRVMDDTDGEGDCMEPEMGLSAALGAAIGGGLGAGVDALFVSRREIRVGFRF